jgi:hypothetical protein
MRRQTGVLNFRPVQPKTDDFSHDLGRERNSKARVNSAEVEGKAAAFGERHITSPALAAGKADGR